MERGDQEIVVIHYDGNQGRCDESKCVSKGVGYLYDESNTCYGDLYGAVFPMMCADGFLPVIVEDEPSLIHTSRWGSIPVSYFTCCPPNEKASNETVVTRRCSDPITGFFDMTDNGDNSDTEIPPTVCDDPLRKYPRQMETSWGVLAVGTFSITPSKTDSYLCCDSDLDENIDDAVAGNYLDELECVPYRNNFYEFRKAQNLVGLLRVITCDFPEGDFVFPRPLDGATYADFESTGVYQCCKSGPPLPPFVNDGAFKLNTYLPLALWSLAAVVCIIVCTALLIPLFNKLCNGKLKRRTGSVSLGNSPNQVQAYSTYNLYLVYLFFFDLVFALFQIGWFGSFINQKFNPAFYHVMASPTNLVYSVTVIRAPDGPITYGYVFINMWINFIISWQVLDLLRMSKQAKRIRQPSLTRINIQVGTVFVIAVIYGYALRLLSDTATKAGQNGEFEIVERLSTTVQVVWIFMLVFPVVCIGAICVTIWWGNYIPSLDTKSSASDSAMKQLFFFFLRIVAIFYGVWLPATVIVIAGIVKFTAWYYLLAWCLLAVQPLLSACMILTKCDVRKYILDLVTIHYCLGSENKSTWKDFSRKKSEKTEVSNSCNDEDEQDGSELVLGFRTAVTHTHVDPSGQHYSTKRGGGKNARDRKGISSGYSRRVDHSGLVI